MKLLLSFLFLISSLLGEDIYATFDVVARKEANLALTTSGVVKTLRVDVGSHVKQGDILLEIDNDNLVAGVDLAKESLKKAQIEEQFARQTYDRYKKVESVIDAELMDQNTLIVPKSLCRTRRSQRPKCATKTPFSKKHVFVPLLAGLFPNAILSWVMGLAAIPYRFSNSSATEQSS